jgi:glycosyltransferase involved in cell wall biosynthesis
MRRELGIAENQLVILNTGRVAREKGLFELMEAISLAASREPRITCIIVGSKPAFDETVILRRKLEQTPKLSQSVKILPACTPDKIWEYLCAADLFAFTSHSEGMPNSLLEAMAMGLPAIAFGIPPILEIEAGTGAVVTVPPFSSTLFAETILRLAALPDERRRIGERGRSRVLDRFMVQKNMAVALERLAQIRTQSSNTMN